MVLSSSWGIQFVEEWLSAHVLPSNHDRHASSRPGKQPPVDFAALIEGYELMTPALRLRAKTRYMLQQVTTRVQFSFTWCSSILVLLPLVQIGKITGLLRISTVICHSACRMVPLVVTTWLIKELVIVMMTSQVASCLVSLQRDLQKTVITHHTTLSRRDAQMRSRGIV
jgi:hypothetical protein